MSFLILILGLIGLWLGTKSTLHGALTLAQRFGLSEFIVGVAILSIGTDIPELAIAIEGGIRNWHGAQVSDVIVGSALGSGLSQIGFVLGLTGLFGYLTLPKEVTYQHGGLLLGSLLLLALFGFDGTISRIEGLSLLIVYLIYLVFIFGDKSSRTDEELEGTNHSLVISILYLLFGIFVVFISAELTVSSVIKVADSFNINQGIVAILIVGFGTSLPELSISLGALLKGKSRMSVGNLIGSNIFDTLVPIGAAATISELKFSTGFIRTEIPILFLLSFLILIFFIRKKGIQKREAFTILALYFIYVTYKLFSA